MIVAGTAVDTTVVVIVKVAVVAPAATVTVAGRVAFELLDVKPTLRPPVGAGPVSVTVPVEGLPPITVLGETLTLVTVGGLIVSVAVLLVPP